MEGFAAIGRVEELLGHFDGQPYLRFRPFANAGTADNLWTQTLWVS